MVIATFGPSTAWAGKKISREGDFFILEYHGPISPQGVMEYDQQSQLNWAHDGMRAWAGSLAQSPVSKVAISNTLLWCAAFIPLLWVIPPLALPGWVLCAFDLSNARKVGVETRDLAVWVVLFPPVYFYQRLRRTGQSLAPFTVALVCTFVGVVGFLVVAGNG